MQKRAPALQSYAACSEPERRKSSMAKDSKLTARTFETRLRKLVAGFGRERENESCIACERCVACDSCTFCSDSERLIRCNFCVRCLHSSDSLHCRDSRGLNNCQHCIQCENCSASSYLVRSIALSNCSYCFGCVGLAGRDFHILNERYERRDYFELLNHLSRELKL